MKKHNLNCTYKAELYKIRCYYKIKLLVLSYLYMCVKY